MPMNPVPMLFLLPKRCWPLTRALVVAAVSVLAGCSFTNPLAPMPKAVYQSERFQSDETFSRLFDGSVEDTCEAARRALLSQGYIINTASNDLVEGQKSFQPEAESHLQMVIRVVCAPESPDGKISLGFVTALQDSYQLKKSNNSASLGVGAIGSVSLPFTSGNDSMVKVGSVTISSDEFYEGFFDLVSRYLATVDDLPPGAR